MLPRIRYAKTCDGISIAFSSVGRGQPVVFASNPCELHSNSPHPQTRVMTDDLVRLGWQVVRYDLRGMGASDRQAEDLSLDGYARDIEAVTGQLDARKFALVGISVGAAIAVAYAASHPEQVSRLVLIEPFPSGADWEVYSPLRRVLQSIAHLAEDDWTTFTLTVGNVTTNFTSAEEARGLASMLERSATPGAFLRYENAMRDVDLTPLLPRIETPALVIHSPNYPIGSVEMCRRVASLMPNAQLVDLSGDGSEDTALIDAFLRSSPGHGTPASESAGANGHLTPREADVLQLIAGGRTNREIADGLVLSERTVARHITNIYGKLHLRSRAEATAYAFRHHLT